MAITSRSLQDTPTWALATVCFIFISLSLFVEHLIHLLCNWLKRHRKTALFEAAEKVKSVLILLGFMSLLLAVTQRPISKICIPTKVAYTMLPCQRDAPTKTTKSIGLFFDKYFEDFHSDVPGRRLADEDEDDDDFSSSTTTNSSSDYCESQGKTSFISQDGINQLNNFLFVLAIMQIVYSVLTMALGRAKMKRWDAWEKETQTVDYQIANDPNRFRYTRQTTFARRHLNSFTTSSILLWIECFFRQFFNSVARVDYLTLRHGFISAHLSTNHKFNFRKYIERSLEDDFKVVVGISPFMWFLVVLFMLVDVHGWHVYLWVSLIPLLLVLVLGTKLEMIVAKMAHKLNEKASVIIGSPLVQPNDDLFWFGHPKYVLTFLHLTLFMNSFEIAFFVWVTWQFGINSCYHEQTQLIIIRVVLAVTVQVICSYITLPLYALVTQMGSNFKSSVLEENTVKAIRQWHDEVKRKRKKKHKASNRNNDHDYVDYDDDDQSTTNNNNNNHDYLSTSREHSSTLSLNPDHRDSSRHVTFTNNDRSLASLSTNSEIVEDHSSSVIYQDHQIGQDQSLIILPSTMEQDLEMHNVDEKPFLSN